MRYMHLQRACLALLVTKCASSSSLLVERRNNVSAGIAVKWVFVQSGTRVERNE